MLSKEVFMAIRALYEIKDAPLALIVDMYKNAMVPSIDGRVYRNERSFII